ncbi:MAG TPA: thioesterase family protein [Chitinophagaceae bacterium]|nr:thioesterase family protein [Chitinophagaceae bacterium]
MYSSIVEMRVKYGETDSMGYLYYGNYALYYEVGRTELIRDLGFSYKELEEKGIMMPVVEYRSKYVRPALYDDILTIKTSLRDFPKGKKITFYTELFNEKKQRLNTGFVILVFVDKRSGKTTGLPPILKEKLTPFFD